MVRRLFLSFLLVLAGAHGFAQNVFFEPPVGFTAVDFRFPKVASHRDGAVLAYQQIVGEEGNRSLRVIVRSTTDGLTWSDPTVVAEGLRFEGTSVPPVFDMAVAPDGAVAIVTLNYQQTGDGEGATLIRVRIADAPDRPFRVVHSIPGEIRLVAPSVFAAANGGWFLTFERLDAAANRIVYAYSQTGEEWPGLLALPADAGQTGPQSDVAHVAVGERDVFFFVGENIVPPSPPRDADGRLTEPAVPDTPQLYAIYTDDSGATWGASDPAGSRPHALKEGVSVDIPILDLEGALIPHFYLRVTDQPQTRIGVANYADLVMRRPSAVSDGTQIGVAFEAAYRRETANVPQLAFARADRSGNLIDSMELLTASTVRRADARIAHSQPIVTMLDGRFYLAGVTDPARGGDVLLLERDASGWSRVVASARQFAASPTGAQVGGRLHFFWHSRSDNTPGRPTRIVYLEPDQRALPPIVRGANFTIGRRSAEDSAAFAWTPAPDASGIVGYRYLWTRDPDEPVPARDALPSTTAVFPADADGEWHLRIRALDRAGNWSPATTATFFRDTTPPARVTFTTPRLDEEGFLTSNTFRLTWNPPEVDVDGEPEVVSSYISDLVYIGPHGTDVDVRSLPVVEPRPGTRHSEPAIARDNHDNGLWALTVRAVDSVGNVGPPAVLYVRMNKYIPVTIITTVAAVPDILGRYALDIVGRGFTADGRISRIVLDRDGRAPYDYVFDESSPGFRVFSDRTMAGPLLDNISSGEYLIGLFHTERGMRFFDTRLTIERNGTVKFGDFTVLVGQTLVADTARLFRITPPGFIAWVVIALIATIALLSGGRVVAVAREGVQLKLEARALISGQPGLIEQREERIAQMKQRGIGLRAKFAFFVVILVVSVVAMIAVGLGSATLNSQQAVLVRALKERVDVLMESMVSGAGEPLLEPDFNTLALEGLPASTRAMEEALYATITGPVSSFAPAGFAESVNYIWGSNDPVVRAAGVTDPAVREALTDERAAQGADRTPVPDDSVLFLGRTLLQDPLSERIETLRVVIDRLSRSRLNSLLKERELTFARIDELRQEIDAIAFAGRDATALERDRQRLRLTFDSLNQQLRIGIDDVAADAALLVGFRFENEGSYTVPDRADQIESDLASARSALASDPVRLTRLSDPVQSVPPFVTGEFDPAVSDLLFFRVIVEPDVTLFPTDSAAIDLLDITDTTDLSYFRGTVRIGVGTDLIVEQIDQARRDIFGITALIALAAVGAGILGALLLATIVVSPINKLVRGVEHIRDTVDKSDLKEYQIKLRSKDELFRLADTINTMTYALAVAAEAERALRVTSDLQKKFIPLEEVAFDGTKKRKLTMAHLDTDGLEFHGYYEGADALSGDYFTFEPLDATRYAFIKCDVSGHGVNAAFIMVEVATIFLNRVREWRTSKRPPGLTDLLTTVNELLIDRGFEGMFAAMVVGVVDGATGEVRMSHAGDVEQRFYRVGDGRVELVMLPGAPATGVFEFDMFQEKAQSITHGDLMLLATDGIEESARFMRDGRLDMLFFSAEEAAEIEASAKALDPPSSIEYDQKENFVKEEFSTARWERIVEEVQRGGSFQLRRVRSLEPDERLLFTYRGLDPTAENTVLAIMAAEKVFRLTPDPKNRSEQPVRVDRKIDDFLRDHFSEYRRYFAHPVPDDRRPDAKDLRSEYVYYTNLFEEVQSDDLTILVVRRK
ncbi:MAG: HAMP domain-containing protein [Spirochaetaceae bacterium]|nr:MAG: HAMP domain-containing protein [Spirochaetaceae bacterium]